MGLVKRTHTGKIICFEQTPPNLNTVYGGEGGGVQLTEVLKVLKQYIWPVAQEIIFFFFFATI